ncbi:periplasmic serine protease [Solemya velum gill symbiont]|uniref:Probable periplasmic serine endoprotease DegP-like n=1 Tax=Solemya velum gill symbiont TaxID=2340 RepID=A0A0B0H729_SOVGS|nr:DegQ family serine endoprotease [Solemya velum gill symbiont]KHF24452.1 periplasmic serine protease [Solemya velum gill symbiont]
MIRTITAPVSAFLMTLTLLFSAVAHAQLPDFTELAEKNSPAVVNISTKHNGTSGNKSGKHHFDIPEMPGGAPFDDLLKRFFGEQFDFDQMPDFKSESLGSGFIISEDGYVMTNHHVVNDADEVIVRLADRREFTAEIIGSDKQTDVALLKIDADGLPTVKVGNGADLKVGEWVLAIGSPFGFDHSVTAGIVSAKGRSLPEENYVPFIQTDVAINPGNSGGPLFNLDGEVVGVNSQIYSRSGGFMGLSFSIPIEVAMNVADQLRSKGKVSRGWLGVLIQDVTRELAESFDMEKPMGALVARVMPDSPAEKAGMQVGDIIIRFNGKPVEKSSKLPPMVGSASIDRPAQVVVLRAGDEKTISVNIGELPDEQLAMLEKEPQPEPEEKETILGLVVSNLTQMQRNELGIAEGGVIVEEVQEGPARKAGIRTGEVIAMIGSHRIMDVDDFRKGVEKLPKEKPIAILVQQKEGSRWLTLRLSD